MNPTEFVQARGERLKAFELKYAGSKREYLDAVSAAKTEPDRARQCVLIKKALDKNKDLTATINEYLVGDDNPDEKVDATKIRKLHEDIALYKAQHELIQQGKDSMLALEVAKSQLNTKIDITKANTGLYFFLSILIGGILLLTILGSGIRRAFYANAIAPVFPGRFTQPRYF